MCLGIFSTTKIEFPGELIARIELIAPVIKDNRDIETQYSEKRQNAIRSERCLIELDYLYSETADTRYSITTTIRNETSVVSFGVTDAIPNIQIYLDDNELFELELGKVYNHTFSQSRFFYKVIVDYEQEPLHMDSFSPNNQQAIRDTMARLAETQK